MKPRILIADRDRGLADTIRRCLDSHGFEVVVASDGLQCLDQLRSVAPTVLVLDPGILWGGADGIVDWLNQEDLESPPFVAVFDGPCGCSLPERFHSRIDLRMDRPRSLTDLFSLVHQLETLVLDSGHSAQESDILSSGARVGSMAIPVKACDEVGVENL